MDSRVSGSCSCKPKRRITISHCRSFNCSSQLVDRQQDLGVLEMFGDGKEVSRGAIAHSQVWVVFQGGVQPAEPVMASCRKLIASSSSLYRGRECPLAGSDGRRWRQRQRRISRCLSLSRFSTLWLSLTVTPAFKWDEFQPSRHRGGADKPGSRNASCRQEPVPPRAFLTVWPRMDW
jgi:hypothetical protein